MKILLAALIAEGLLVAASLLLQYLFDVHASWNTSLSTIAIGIALTIPPLVINQLLWSRSQRQKDSIYHRFSEEIIIPLCRNITPRLAVVIAVLSGVCEELFFRGALNSLSLRYFGPIASCLLTSVLFAAVHFLGSFKRYGAMIPLYTAMGVYLWGVWHLSQSLSAVAVLHGVYNFTVIMLVKRFVAKQDHSLNRAAPDTLHRALDETIG